MTIIITIYRNIHVIIVTARISLQILYIHDCEIEINIYEAEKKCTNNCR